MRPATRVRRWSLVTAVVITTTAVLTACDRSTDVGQAPEPTAIEANATVQRVIDGDTVDVRVAGRSERVRLIGIDTPEPPGGTRPPECFGAEASAYTESLLPPGTAVRLVRDEEARDDYGRLLAYVERAADGLFVNLHLAETGHADALTIEPNTAHAGAIGAAVAAAQRAGLGLWSACGGPDVPLDR